MSVYLSVCLSVCGRWPAERLGRSKPNLAWGLMLTQGMFYARSRSGSFGATWRMLIKLLTEARKGRENLTAKRSEAGKGRENSSAKRSEARKGRDWRHLANANKTPSRGPQGRDSRAYSAIFWQRPARAERIRAQKKYGGERPAGPRQ